MMRFILRNWLRHRQRFVLLMIGVLTISTGLSYLLGLSETSRGTVDDLLQKRWKSSYDIVVRPADTRATTEQKGLLEPNYLSGIPGGISLQQYHDIQKIDGVDVAAPVAMIGYVGMISWFDAIPFDDGVYRLEMKSDTNMGPAHDASVNISYYSPNLPNVQFYKLRQGSGEASFFYQKQQPQVQQHELLVAIDPVQEAKLDGLDKAVLPVLGNRYFTADDTVSYLDSKGTWTAPGAPPILRDVTLPVLMTNQPFSNTEYTYTVQKLDIPVKTDADRAELTQILTSNRAQDYLQKAPTVGSPKTYTYDARQVYATSVEQATGMNPQTGQPADASSSNRNAAFELEWNAEPLSFSDASSPFPDRWPFAYKVNTVTAKDVDNTVSQSYRPLVPSNYMEQHQYALSIIPSFLGFYDPTKLNISSDPTNELPMETYRPATATYVLDATGKPVNPPRAVNSADSPYGLLTSPPTMLTTLDSASVLVGDKPISAIRIRVSGVSGLGEDSQQKIEAVAKAIRDKTGLMTDITLGSSPQPTLLHVPKTTHFSAAGWVELPFIKLGTAITIFREAKLGMTGIIAVELLVAILYVFATSLVSFMARRKEFAVLLAVGWRPSRLMRMLFLESFMLGLLVVVISCIVELLIGWQHGSGVSVATLACVILVGLGVYLIGALWPALLVTRISPYETMRTGETVTKAKRLAKTNGTLKMALNHMAGTWTRSLLSVFAIAVPTTLLVFFSLRHIPVEGDSVHHVVGAVCVHASWACSVHCHGHCTADSDTHDGGNHVAKHC